jgi:hypothetical protein
MSNEIAIDPAQTVTATPAAEASPADETVTSDALPQEGTAAETPASARPSRAQERIEELSARSKAAQEYGEYWRQRFEESQQKQQPAPQPVQEQSDPEPNADDFIDPKDFTKAYASWSRKETEKSIRKAAEEAKVAARAESEQTLAKARETERLRTLDDSFTSRAQQYAAKNPDFWDAIRNPSLKFFNGEFLEAAKGSDLGPDVLHHIAKSPKLASELAGKSIPQRLAMLGRLEAELSRPAPPPKVTAAPAPPTPVGSGAGGEIDPSKLSMADWVSWRTKQIQAKGQAR